MSDQPLFQNTDDQEAAYAPQQLPEGTHGAQAAEADERTSDADTTDEAGVPVAGAAVLSQAGQGFTGSASGANPAGPAVIAAAADDKTTGPAPDDD